MIGSIIGGIAGLGAASDAGAAQAAALAEQMARLNKISVPEAQKLVVEQLVQQGQMTPEIQEAFNLPDSEVSKIKDSVDARKNQEQAINLIKQRAEGGLSATDRADFNTMRNQVARDEQAKQAQILQQMQARGMGGSGAELAAQLANSQNSSQTASEQSDALASTATKNAMEAAAQLASQSGALRQADIGLENTKATAADEYNRFNTANKQQVANSNVGIQNAAQAQNLAEKQRVADTNVSGRNQENVRYQGALQDQFNNEFKKATGLNSISSAQGQNNANTAIAKGQAIGAIGNAFDSTVGAAFGNPLAGLMSGGGAGKPTLSGSPSSTPGTMFASKGGQVPGVAEFKGDDIHNDTVQAMLSPGEVIIPKSVMESDNPAKEASNFIKGLQKRASLDTHKFLTKHSLNRGQK